jgi:hypothetical protein
LSRRESHKLNVSKCEVPVPMRKKLNKENNDRKIKNKVNREIKERKVEFEEISIKGNKNDIMKSNFKEGDKNCVIF